MAGTGPSSGGPKILLAKPANARSESGGIPGGPPAVKLMRDRDEDCNVNRGGRLPHGSLNLLSSSWDFQPDRFISLMLENTDYTVVAVMGPPGVGKSTIMNELYGFDGTASGVLPPFSVQTDETKATARHCSVGLEMRVAAERLILLDCQPVFSPSVLMDLMRSDGFANVSVQSGETLSAELAHEVIGLQLGVFLASVCHVLLIVSDGVHDARMWRLMQTIDMLKHGIPDPSTLPHVAAAAAVLPSSSSAAEADDPDAVADDSVPDIFADVVFVHTKLRREECAWPQIQRLAKALSAFFPSPAFRKNLVVKYKPPQFPGDRLHWATNGDQLVNERNVRRGENGVISLSGRNSALSNAQGGGVNATVGEEKYRTNLDKMVADLGVNFFLLPLKVPDELKHHHHESFTAMLMKLRNQILSMPRRSFARPLSERDWLRNAGRMWDLVKKSPVLIDYTKFLQSTGLYRR